ncbi:MAG: DNA polymerase III subunit beta [Patescibacteria group bacterium]
MKATILQSNFSKAINVVSRVVGTRTTLPVLNNILLSIDKGKIKLSATDLEVAITTQVIGKIDDSGKVTIPARLLSDFVHNNSDEQISIETKDLSVNLRSDRFEATIQGIDADEFPTIPDMDKDAFCELAGKDLIDVLKKVTISAANDETRPVLAGVYMKFEGKSAIFAATDSYRLSEKKIALSKEVEKKEIIVPARTMNELLRILSGEMVEKVKLIAEENQISFVVADTQIVSRLIEGNFPNYEQIIPKSSKINVKAPTSETLSAIKMSALFAKDMANNIKIICNKDGMTVKSATTGAGSTTSHVKANVSGGEIEVSFNARYLLDVINILPDEDIVLSFNDEASAGVIKSEKDKEFVYLVMPLRTEQ